MSLPAATATGGRATPTPRTDRFQRQAERSPLNTHAALSKSPYGASSYQAGSSHLRNGCVRTDPLHGLTPTRSARALEVPYAVATATPAATSVAITHKRQRPELDMANTCFKRFTYREQKPQHKGTAHEAQLTIQSLISLRRSALNRHAAANTRTCARGQAPENRRESNCARSRRRAV